MNLKRPILFVAALLGVAYFGGASPTLKVGDPAPKLLTGNWVQGEPVKEFQKGKAYIVEFWATWCGPCRASIPHLNELYSKFQDKGLVVIGQNIAEKEDDKVAPFVKKMGEKMTYRVALDQKSGSDQGKMLETWMAAAGQGGIPTAFLVDTKGIIVWIGSPMALNDKMIENVLAGKPAG
jgi:thiol-disulfide isomerase/thioredoxin